MCAAIMKMILKISQGNINRLLKSNLYACILVRITLWADIHLRNHFHFVAHSPTYICVTFKM